MSYVDTWGLSVDAFKWYDLYLGSNVSPYYLKTGGLVSGSVFTTGNVGVGTTVANERLVVSGNANVSGTMRGGNLIATNSLNTPIIENPSSIQFVTNGTERLLIGVDGMMYFNQNTLHEVGNLYVTNLVSTPRIETSGATALNLATNGVDRLTISSAGAFDFKNNNATNLSDVAVTSITNNGGTGFNLRNGATTIATVNSTGIEVDPSKRLCSDLIVAKSGDGIKYMIGSYDSGATGSHIRHNAGYNLSLRAGNGVDTVNRGSITMEVTSAVGSYANIFTANTSGVTIDQDLTVRRVQSGGTTTFALATSSTDRLTISSAGAFDFKNNNLSNINGLTVSGSATFPATTLTGNLSMGGNSITASNVTASNLNITTSAILPSTTMNGNLSMGGNSITTNLINISPTSIGSKVNVWNAGGETCELSVSSNLPTATIYPPVGMTGFTTPSPYIVEQSSEAFGCPAWRAFDKNYGLTTYWVSAHGSGIYNGSTGNYVSTVTTTDVNNVEYKGEYLGIKLANPIILVSYDIYPRGDAYINERSPNIFWVLGSNNGTSWYLVDSRSNVGNYVTTAPKSFTVSGNTSAYQYYRMVIGQVGNSGTDRVSVQIAEWELWGITSLGGSLNYTASPTGKHTFLNGSTIGLTIQNGGATTSNLTVTGSAILPATTLNGNLSMSGYNLTASNVTASNFLGSLDWSYVINKIPFPIIFGTEYDLSGLTNSAWTNVVQVSTDVYNAWVTLQGNLLVRYGAGLSGAGNISYSGVFAVRRARQVLMNGSPSWIDANINAFTGTGSGLSPTTWGVSTATTPVQGTGNGLVQFRFTTDGWIQIGLNTNSGSGFTSWNGLGASTFPQSRQRFTLYVAPYQDALSTFHTTWYS